MSNKITIAPGQDLRMLNTATREGREKFFGLVVKIHRPFITSIARGFSLPAYMDENDIHQNVNVKIHINLDTAISVFQKDGENGLKGWICTITQRECLNAIRPKSNKMTDLFDGSWFQQRELTQVSDAHSFQKDRQIETFEHLQQMQEAALHLPPRLKEVLDLRKQDYDYAEIAEKLNVSFDTVKGNVKTLLSRLRSILRYHT
jgi:RNA polymerase sigma factor (sigma-70 family)